MIDELRILTKDGVSVYRGSFLKQNREFVEGRTMADFLFAGLISAILSVSEEVQNEKIQEISFKQNRLVLHAKQELIFVATVNDKVPISEVDSVLEEVSGKIIDIFDGTYMAVSNTQKDKITSTIQNTLIRTFWWVRPRFGVRNTFKLYRTALFNPDKTYYFSYLPSIYLIFAIITAALPLLVATLFGTEFAGLATEPAYSPDFTKNIITMSLLWVATGVIIKIPDKSKFKLTSYLTLTGIYMSYLSIMMFFSSFYYRYILIGGLIDALSISELAPILLFVLVRIPVNLAFFGYIIIAGYGTLFATTYRNSRYLIIYTASTLIVIFLIELLNFIV